jgi:hypothetical protein
MAAGLTVIQLLSKEISFFTFHTPHWYVGREQWSSQVFGAWGWVIIDDHPEQKLWILKISQEFVEFPFIWLCSLKIVERRKSISFSSFRIFILPPLGLCHLGQPHHLPPIAVPLDMNNRLYIVLPGCEPKTICCTSTNSILYLRDIVNIYFFPPLVC